MDGLACPTLPTQTVFTVISTADDGTATLEGWDTPVKMTALQKTRTASILVQDFAGQDEYYITHSLFLTNGVLIVICFQLSKVFDETSFEEEVLFFLRNIRARVPNVRVLLIGTKSDLVPGGAAAIESKQKLVKSLMEKEAAKEQLRLMRTSAKPKRLASDARATLCGQLGPRAALASTSCVRRSKVPSATARPSPTSALKSLAVTWPCATTCERCGQPASTQSWNGTSTATARSAGGPRGRWRALLSATDLMHKLGELLYYGDTELSSTVFPNPSFLIDMMKYVIRHDHEEALRMDPAFVDGMTAAVFAEAKQNFIRRGILSHRLLRRMWAPLGLTDSQFERLVQLLEQFEIALSLPDDSVEPRLLVPSFPARAAPRGRVARRLPDGHARSRPPV